MKFLFERLKSRAGTKGVFRLGERLPILCGANPSVEADLLDAAHKLAVMLDVSAELSDLDAYRRARREDWLLQRNGYRVVRLLAEDVCARLDETLAFIELRYGKGFATSLFLLNDGNLFGSALTPAFI